MSKYCCFKAQYFIEQLILVASGIFELVEFCDLGLSLQPPCCCIIACHGFAVQLYMQSVFLFMWPSKYQAKMLSYSDMILIRICEVFQAKWCLSWVVMVQTITCKTSLKSLSPLAFRGPAFLKSRGTLTIIILSSIILPCISQTQWHETG